MNYYQDGTDFTPGYNPIISDTRIPEEYNPNKYTPIGECLNVRCNPWTVSGLFEKLYPLFIKRITII